jgi:hypothetical protein
MRKLPKRCAIAQKKQAAVLKVIENSIGKPCPTTDELAKATGLTKSDISRATSALYFKGILQADTDGATRKITIIATGESTLPGIFFNKRGIQSQEQDWPAVTGINMDGVRYEDATNIPLEDAMPFPVNHPISRAMPRIRTNDAINVRLKEKARNVYAKACA